MNGHVRTSIARSIDGMTAACAIMAAVACGSADSPARDGLDPPRCVECSIALTPVIQIGFTEAPVAPASGALIALDRNHERFMLVAAPFRSEFHEFDASGRYVTSVGQEGPGPEEYSFIAALEFDASDSLWVFDTGNARIDVFGPDLARARSLPIEGTVQDVIALNDGTFAIRGILTDSTGAISVARLLRRDGSTFPLVREGDGPSGVDPAGELGALAEDRDRRQLWVSALHAYSIQLRSTFGEVDRTFERAPPWFQVASPSVLDRYPDLDLQPTILDLAVDVTGKLWVIAGTTDRHLPPPEAATDGVVDIDDWVDTVIEVIDPAGGALITSARFDHAPPRFLRDGLVYRVVFDPNGQPWIDISRFDYTEF